MAAKFSTNLIARGFEQSKRILSANSLDDSPAVEESSSGSALSDFRLSSFRDSDGGL